MEEAARLIVIRPADRAPEASSGPMRREAGCSESLTGAHRIWSGFVELGPAALSAAHHHGEAESSIYIISGHARFVTADQVHDAEAGDFVFVPPNVVHIEANRSDLDPVRMVVSRSTQDALVTNVETPADWVLRARAPTA
jgi:uncharacterized RmlC-like cupin family protein